MELCKWTIDLGALPSFQQNASVPNSNGFYTGASVFFRLRFLRPAGPDGGALGEKAGRQAGGGGLVLRHLRAKGPTTYAPRRRARSLRVCV